jgi:hypothetical protein
MDKQKLIERLRRIESLYAGATTPGERIAASNARDRIRERLRTFQAGAVDVEYRFTLSHV